MKKFTLLVSLLLCTASVTAQVSQKSIRTRLKAPKSVVTGKISAQQLKKKISGKRKTAAALPIWMPESEKFYIYEDGEWLLMASSSLTYDKAGNPLTVTMDEDGWLTRNTYAYDSNNMMISNIEENDESGSGEEWLYSTKTTKTYDPVVTDFVTSVMEYEWDDVESNWGPGNKQSKKYEVTRDDKGRVTSLEISAYFSYTDSWDIVSRVDITYDAATGKAVTYSYRQADEYDPDTQKTVLGAPTVYKNIEWENTNGQILSEFDELLLGDNRFKKADVYYGAGEGEDGDAEFGGHFEVTYVEGKADFVCTGISADRMEKEVHTYTTTDENGSFVEEIAYYMDENEDGEFTDDECVRESLIMEYDKLGNCTLEEYRGQEEPGAPYEIIGGSRTTYTYDDSTGAVKEALQEEYSVEYDENDEPLSGQYVPMGKIVYEDFKDVTAIESVMNDSQGTKAIYNLHGVAVGVSTDNLPAGIYIVKKGSKAYKMIKR